MRRDDDCGDNINSLILKGLCIAMCVVKGTCTSLCFVKGAVHGSVCEESGECGDNMDCSSALGFPRCLCTSGHVVTSNRTCRKNCLIF